MIKLASIAAVLAIFICGRVGCDVLSRGLEAFSLNDLLEAIVVWAGFTAIFATFIIPFTFESYELHADHLLVRPFKQIIPLAGISSVEAVEEKGDRKAGTKTVLIRHHGRPVRLFMLPDGEKAAAMIGDAVRKAKEEAFDKAAGPTLTPGSPVEFRADESGTTTIKVPQERSLVFIWAILAFFSGAGLLGAIYIMVDTPSSAGTLAWAAAGLVVGLVFFSVRVYHHMYLKLEIWADRTEIRIQYKPLPLLPARRIRVSEITDIYIADGKTRVLGIDELRKAWRESEELPDYFDLRRDIRVLCDGREDIDIEDLKKVWREGGELPDNIEIRAASRDRLKIAIEHKDGKASIIKQTETKIEPEDYPFILWKLGEIKDSASA